MSAAAMIVTAVLIYMATGLFVALPVAAFRVASFNSSGGELPRRVRVLVLPGLAMLWPLTLTRALIGMRSSKPGDSA